MRIRRGRSIGALAVAAGLLATAACGNGGGKAGTSGAGTDTRAAGKGGTLKIVASSDLTNLDTSQEYEVVGQYLFRAITRQLTAYPGDAAQLKDDVEAKDDLAASHTVSPDGLTYTFPLRDGITFSGPSTRAIVSTDFEYALKRLCDPNGPSGAIGYYTATIKGMKGFCDGFAKVKTGDVAAVKTYIDGHKVAGIDATDPKKVVFTLTQKAGDFLNIVALSFATPLPEEVVSKYLTDSPEFKQNFVSSGPYYIANYTPDKSYDFKRSPNYNAASDPLRKSFVDEITVDLAVGSDESQFQQINADQADLSLDITTPPAPVTRAAQQANDGRLHISPEGRVDYLVFNSRPQNATSPCGKAVQDPKVRQAFNYAIDKTAIVQIRGGAVQSVPTGQILTSTITGYKKNDPYATPDSKGDPAKAKAMLAAAGFPKGLTCRLIHRTKNKNADIATELQQNLAAAGITVQLNKVPDKDYYSKHLQKPTVNDWDISVPGWSPDWQGKSARSFFLPLLSKKFSPCQDGTTNYGCYGNDEVDAQVDAALAADDPATLWAGVDARVMQDAPWAPLVEQNAVVITSKRLKGFHWYNLSDGADITNVGVS